MLVKGATDGVKPPADKGHTTKSPPMFFLAINEFGQLLDQMTSAEITQWDLKKSHEISRVKCGYCYVHYNKEILRFHVHVSSKRTEVGG